MNDVTEVIDEINKGLENSDYKKIASEAVNAAKLSLNPDYLHLCDYIDAIMAPLSQRLKEMQDVFNNSRISSVISEILSIYKNSPFWDWLNSFDFSAVLSTLKEEEKEALALYMKTMYECKWFPVVGFTSKNKPLLLETCSIVASSRGISKRREKRIDKLVLDFYDANAIKSIKSGWDESDLEPYLKRMLKQAINAHLREEYYLTVSGLVPLWESLIQIKEYGVICQVADSDTKKINKNTKMAFADLVTQNGHNTLVNEFYKNNIMGYCDKVDKVPNRNGVAHGKWFNYPSKKESLNAILITDFIIKLQVK